MKSSNGAFTHDSIMEMPWRLFSVYLDAFNYIDREQSEGGRKDNLSDDIKSKSRNPAVKKLKQQMLEESKMKTKKGRGRVESKKKGKSVRSGRLDELLGKK